MTSADRTPLPLSRASARRRPRLCETILREMGVTGGDVVTVCGDARLLAHYAELAHRWPVVDRRQDYSKLVVPTGNSAEPFHRWFHLKEAFSHQLLPRVLKDDGLAGQEEIALFDPFVGSGTTVLSAISSDGIGRVSAHGVERNPFLHLLARAKMLAATNPQPIALAESLTVLSHRIAGTNRRSTSMPDQATLRNEKYFDADAVLYLRALNEQIVRDVPEPESSILRICVAASLERCGRLRRDGRALRYEPNKLAANPYNAFKSAVEKVSLDLLSGSGLSKSTEIEIHLGDARKAAQLIGNSAEADLTLFSPPYPNNIDYTEVYKTEAWLLDLFSDKDQFRNHRHSTLRSHPSVMFADSYSYLAESSQVARAVDELVEPLANAIPRDRWLKIRSRLVRGYVDDMYQVFSQCAQVAKPNSRMVFVVGNSRHGNSAGSFEVAADLLLAATSELAGWTVDEIRVARSLKRRGSDSELLRESVVSLHRDEDSALLQLTRAES